MSLGFHLAAARLYGIVVNDPSSLALDAHAEHEHGQAARCSFIDESSDVYQLISGSSGVVARSFDAAAVVTVGWAAPFGRDGSFTARASRHPQRRRVRAVAVIDDVGVASVLRFEDDPEVVIGNAERGVGDMVDAMEAMWFGDPTRWMEPPVTPRGCQRRP